VGVTLGSPPSRERLIAHSTVKKILGLPLDAMPGLPTALMAGIVMDTATFAHPNATPRTLRVAAALLEAGAPLADISRRLYRTKPDEQLQLRRNLIDATHEVAKAAGGILGVASISAAERRLLDELAEVVS